MFKSKYRRRYEQIVSDIKDNIRREKIVIEVLERDVNELIELGVDTSALQADIWCQKEHVNMFEELLGVAELLKRAEEA